MSLLSIASTLTRASAPEGSFSAVAIACTSGHSSTLKNGCAMYASGTLSLGSNPVKLSGWRERDRDAPRYARISRSRYMPCSENTFTLTVVSTAAMVTIQPAIRMTDGIEARMPP